MLYFPSQIVETLEEVTAKLKAQEWSAVLILTHHAIATATATWRADCQHQLRGPSHSLGSHLPSATQGRFVDPQPHDPRRGVRRPACMAATRARPQVKGYQVPAAGTSMKRAAEFISPARKSYFLRLRSENACEVYQRKRCAPPRCHSHSSARRCWSSFLLQSRNIRSWRR